MLGRDKIPMEFYALVWEYCKLILLEVLCKGLVDGALHPKLMEGLIVLLPKKEDQTLIGNR